MAEKTIDKDIEKLKGRIGRHVEVFGNSEYFGFWEKGLLEIDKDGVYWVNNIYAQRINISQYFGRVDQLKIEDAKEMP